MKEHVSTIGLEIHAELNTRTKMFCDSLNDPHEKEPNQNVCPVCLGHPGALPTINKKAIEHVIRTGLALGGKIAERTKFDRKNYFYPDLPKGYQISQYDEPLVLGGELCGARIKRIHLEEDAGNLIHQDGQSLADYNRAGVPLMELVTEPDIRSAEQAVLFAKELQRIFRYLGVSHANMEKGEMRVEVNISLDMGTKVEVKNLNSFRAGEGAIRFEAERQKKALESGEKIIQETRGWDDVKRKTISQRSKEEAQDYRYFPEPDLPSFTTDVFDIDRLRLELSELPQEKRERFIKEFSLSSDQADVLIEEKRMADYFEEATSELAERESAEEEGMEGKKRSFALLNNYLTSDLKGLLNVRKIEMQDMKVGPGHLAHLIDLIADGKITSRQAKDMLVIMIEEGVDPEEIMKTRGFGTVTDEGVLAAAAREVVAENEKAVSDYLAGKEASLQFLIGQVMKRLKGRGEPAVIAELLRRVMRGE